MVSGGLLKVAFSKIRIESSKCCLGGFPQRFQGWIFFSNVPRVRTAEVKLRLTLASWYKPSTIITYNMSRTTHDVHPKQHISKNLFQPSFIHFLFFLQIHIMRCVSILCGCVAIWLLFKDHLPDTRHRVECIHIVILVILAVKLVRRVAVESWRLSRSRSKCSMLRHAPRRHHEDAMTPG